MIIVATQTPIIEGHIFNEQLSLKKFVIYEELNIQHGKTTRVPHVRACALPSFRPFCMSVSFISHSLITGSVFFLRSRTCCDSLCRRLPQQVTDTQQ